MDKDKIARLREHYDTTDTAEEIERSEGTWETDVESDPMVTTSLRLPKSDLDWVREQASAAGVKPTALIRRWIGEHRQIAEKLAGIQAPAAGFAALAECVSAVPYWQSIHHAHGDADGPNSVFIIYLAGHGESGESIGFTKLDALARSIKRGSSVDELAERVERLERRIVETDDAHA